MAGDLATMRSGVQLTYALTAAAVVLATWALPILTVTHSFPAYGIDTELEVECHWLSATTNVGRSESGVGACGRLIKSINTDSSAFYLVIPSGVATQAEGIDYVVSIAMPALSLGLLARAFPMFVLTRVVSSNLLALSLLCGIALVNLGLGLRRSLHAAPDPSASTASALGAGFLLLVGVPVTALSAPAT